MSETAVLPLPGMPVPEELHRVEPQGRVVVRRGGRVLFVHDSDDVGMRNLVVVAVTDAGFDGAEFARDVQATGAQFLVRSSARRTPTPFRHLGDGPSHRGARAQLRPGHRVGGA